MWMVVQAETYLWYHHLPFACRKLDKSKFEKSTSTRQYQNADGEVKFQGTPNLVDTQVYPPKFGRKVTLMKPLCMFSVWRSNALPSHNQHDRLNGSFLCT